MRFCGDRIWGEFRSTACSLRGNASMQNFLQQLFAGVSSGSIYAIFALGAVVIYQSTHHLNFAQGEMATFTTYIVWFLLQLGMGYWFAAGIALLASFGLGVAVERGLVSRTARSSPLISILLFIGLFMIFNSASGALFGHTPKALPSPFRAMPELETLYLTAEQSGSIACCLILFGFVYVFFAKTKIGLGMRAAAFNPESSVLAGISIGKMSALGWGCASVLSTMAALLVAPSAFLTPDMMIGVLIYGFAAALVGGLESPLGALVGGLLVGIFKNLVSAYWLGDNLDLTMALFLIFGILLIRPNGVFGRTIIRRV